MRLKQFIPDVITIIFFACLSVAYFVPAEIEGRTLFQHDTQAGAGAGEEARAFYHSTGKRTRWTNALFGGMPTYQMSPSYQSNTPLKFTEKVYSLFLPQYARLLFILFIGFYMFMRAWGCNIKLSALGALLWGLSSYYPILIAAGHIWKLVTLAYIPPTLAGMVWIGKGHYLRGGLITALFAGLQLMSNHIQMSYYFFFVMLAAYLVFAFHTAKHRQTAHLLRGTATLLLSALFAVAVNASNLYHTYTYSKESMRSPSELSQADKGKKDNAGSGLSKEYITNWSYGVDETLTLLIPNFRGGASVPLNKDEIAMQKAAPGYAPLYAQIGQYFGEQPGTAGPVYVGAFVVFLFFLGCILVKGKAKWTLVGLTAFYILLAWGKNFAPLTNFFIDYVPLYNKFRAVSSILVIAEFTMPVLAVLGLRAFYTTYTAGQRKTAVKAALTSFILTAGVCLMVTLAPSLLTHSFISTSEQAVLSQGIPAEHLGPLTENLTAMRQAMQSADAIRSLLFILLGCVVLWSWTKGWLKRSWATLCILLLCGVDLWGIDKRYLNDELFTTPQPARQLFTPTPTDKEILADKEPDFRVLNFASDTFNENNTSYFHKHVGGYHAAKLRRYQELIEHCIIPEMQQVHQSLVQHEGNTDSIPANLTPALNMLNTKYFILPTGMAERSTVPLHNPHRLGAAWFAPHIKVVNNADEELAAVKQPKDIGEVVVRQHTYADLPPAARQAAPAAPGSSIRLTHYTPNHLEYTSESSTGGLAVFSEIFYPGWQLLIDGTPAELIRANYVLRAAYLPKGNHHIEMIFAPASLHLTEGLAYAAQLLFALAVCFLLWRHLRRGSPQTSHHTDSNMQ